MHSHLIRKLPVAALISCSAILLFCAGSGIASNSRQPGGLRCKGRIVYIGDTTFDVFSKCGDPDWSHSYEVERGAKRVQGPPGKRETFFIKEAVLVEEWTYNLGSTRFIRYLTFENGVLVSIETGKYGY
ncbi:MAG: DUF2845 domain-containing protein [Desulforhabdus sp.]|nr:DUF2845 domain-containing protein [Desulforhabdus sp.]